MNLYFVLYIVSVCIASASQLLLKKAADKKHESFVREYLNPFVISGYACLLISMLLTILALRGMEFKNSPIIESLGYVLVLLLSRVFFGERITKAKIIGTVCILAGIVVFYIKM